MERLARRLFAAGRGPDPTPPSSAFFSAGVDLAKKGTTVILLWGLPVAFIGVYLLIGAVSCQTSASPGPRNPFKADARSLAIGKQVYEARCLGCHGPKGQGDGPQVKAFNPRLDITEYVLAHPSGHVFLSISLGAPGTDMPGYEADLSEEERWHVVNYIRTLGRSSGPGFHVH